MESAFSCPEDEAGVREGGWGGTVKSWLVAGVGWGVEDQQMINSQSLSLLGVPGCVYNSTHQGVAVRIRKMLSGSPQPMLHAC